MRSLLLFALVACPLAGCAADAASDDALPDTMVYVDSETRQPVVAERSAETPAVHPDTGRRTLMPGLFCTTCQKWHPAPPLEELQRNPEARQCPTCKGPLTADGPTP